MTVSNLSPETATLTEKQVGSRTEYWFDFGTIKQGHPSTFKAKVENVQARSIRPGCMFCTVAEARPVGNDVEVEATYDAKAKGMFNKTVTLTLKDNTTVIFKLTGTVK